jgi:hypothetical protein
MPKRGLVNWRDPNMTQEEWDAWLKKDNAKSEAEKKYAADLERARRLSVMQEKVNTVKSSIPVLETFNKSIDPDKVIGLPPNYLFDRNLSLSDSEFILSSMPIMAIYPAYPDMPDGDDNRAGLQTFKLNYELGREKYKLILDSADVDYSTQDHCIYAAFTNDASITESFSSEFGESKFEQIGNVTSSAAEELRYMTGKASMGEAIKGMSENMGTILGSLTKAGGGLVGLGEKALEGISGGAGISKILSGSKIDFPLMWKGSSYAPSYSISIRLYNYNPKDLGLHKKYIVDPLAKLLAFIVPLSDSPSTFTYPVLCSISCPGLFMLKAAYVSSIEVIKGGDANNISFIQRPGIVDVKMSFNDLYGSIIAEDVSLEKGFAKDRFRPIFKEYINNLSSYTELPAGPGTVSEYSFEEVATIGKTDTADTVTNDPTPRVPTSSTTLWTDLVS